MIAPRSLLGASDPEPLSPSEQASIGAGRAGIRPHFRDSGSERLIRRLVTLSATSSRCSYRKPALSCQVEPVKTLSKCPAPAGLHHEVAYPAKNARGGPQTVGPLYQNLTYHYISDQVKSHPGLLEVANA
jgi:hypothetical protein